MTKQKEKNWYVRMFVRGLCTLSVLAAAIFILAGRISYWQGRVFIGLAFAGTIASPVLFADKAELIKERMKPGPGTKWWDKVSYSIFIPLYAVLIIIAGLDAGRFKWTAQLPATFYMAAYAAYVLSCSIMLWAMRTNTFFSSVVRIQSDRNHKVVQDGPYRFIRHPGYVAGILLVITSSLILGSLWGLIPAGIIALLFIIRTYLEDATLQKELTGYASYAKSVRYRLLPGIW